MRQTNAVAGPAAKCVVRDLRSVTDMRQVEDLQQEVWEFSDRDIVPLQQLIPASQLGGVVIGAFDRDVLVAFVYGFLGLEHGALVMHSQMLGVKPSHRNLGLGRTLKIAQRQRALAAGIETITWTFDPLQPRNAHFNFCCLGALSDSYRPNFYGEQTSSFLHADGTDRLWVTWPIVSQRVANALENASWQAVPAERIPDAVCVLDVAEDGSPVARLTDLAAPTLLVRIPRPVAGGEMPRRWRMATRQAFSRAVEAGRRVVAFQRDAAGGGTYVLARTSPADLL
jgi:predicted GNAT superfamily acetyltransferase